MFYSRSMARRLDFWFDYTCPYAYLASTQVESLAERSGDDLRWRPMLLGGVFRANATPQKLFASLSPQKAAHNANDMARWAQLFNVPLSMPAAHPLRSVEALRATLATDCDPRVIHGFFHAYWVEGREISSPETMRAVLGAAGYDAAAVLKAVEGDALREALRVVTDEAIGLGVFGAPAYVVEGKTLFWGQDRAHFVERLSAVDLVPPPPRSHRMSHTLEIYWDFSSPFAYLGATQAKALAERTGATLVWRPMLLGGLFKAIGQDLVPLNTWSDAKRRYYYDDMHRWAEFWGVPFQFPAVFPVNSIKALRAYLALPAERQDAFREATFRAYWAEGRDIADDAVLASIIGSDAAEVLARTQEPAVKQALAEATKRAESAGVFGAPTWVVDGKDLYWGQDRIPLVERALTR